MIAYLLQSDTNLLIWARGLMGPDYAQLIQILGESVVLWVAFLLLTLWFMGVAKKDTRYRIWALEIFFVIILTFIIHVIINLGIPQWRISPQLVAGGITPLIPHPIDNSFPSGHALFTMATLFGLWNSYRKRWVIGITIFFGLITAIARVIGGVHYPGDILGGWVFGALGAYIALFIIDTTLFRLYLFPGVVRIASWFRL